MKQASTQSAPSNPAKSGAGRAEPATVTRFRAHAGDLVLVEDPHNPRPFLAEITGWYRLGGIIRVQLQSPPGTTERCPQQSTKARHVTRVWRQAGRTRK